MADRIGQLGGQAPRLLGNYRLVRLLGRGSFAEVYLGEHLYLKSLAALKVLRTELSDEDVASFLAEGQTLARLKHPQIVRVHDFAVEQGIPFLVMDYAPQGTLRQHYPRGSCLSLETVVTYVRHVAEALQYAHNRNVIHRDVKPENILLGTHREALLSDFGLALFAPSPELLSTQKMAGTLPYMAPEQLQGKPGFASDQYALAIIVYEWLCGVRPFEGSYWQLANQHMSALPPPLREKDPSLPAEVERVVLKALAKNPEHRYVSVQLFAQALERAMDARTGVSRNDLEGTGHFPAASPVLPVIRKRIFLSCSQVDKPFAARLQADLQKRGITVWSEQHGDTADTLDEENTLRQAIRAVDVIVLVLSSHARTSRIVREHLRIAALYQRPLVSVWATNEDLAALLPNMWAGTAHMDVIDARESRYTLALDELVICLKKETGVPSFEESTLSESVGEPRNPYKGLRAFTEADTTDFFGREGLIGELVNGVKERLRSEMSGASPARLLAVIGPSGSGKSSVVMAGLLPRLQHSALPGSEQWIYLKPIVPGAHPLEALALALAPHFPERSLKSIREDLEEDSARGLHCLSTHLTRGSEKKVVLLVDQFEEVFNLTTPKDEREHFFNLLEAAITEWKGPVLLILTLRADFYDRLMVSKGMGRLIQQSQLVVWPMEVDELRAAIKGPAALPDVGLTFEGDLVGDLLYEIRGQAGSLPLLQFTLDRLFERRKDHVLTQQAYQEIGGVKGALAKRAEDIYQSLPTQNHQQLAQALFSRLIDPGTLETEATKRRIPLSAFTLIDAAKTEVLAKVLEIFTHERLLTMTTIGDVAMVELSHEALIGAWGRLQEWLHEAREMIRLQQIISQDAADWQQHDHSPDRLYRGTQLAEALLWRYPAIPNIDEDAFLQASVDEQQRLQGLERARRRRFTRRLFVIGGVGVIGAGLTWWLLASQRNESNPLYTYHGHSDFVMSVTWLPDGKRIASGSYDKTVQVWDAVDGGHVYTYRGDINKHVTCVVRSPDGKRIASGGDGKNVQVWDAQNGGHVYIYQGHSLDIHCLAWSPDGTRIASGSQDSTVKVWNAQDGHLITTYSGHVWIWTVAWSPDGRRIASGSDDQTVQVWDAQNGNRLLTYSLHSGKINAVAWSPDGRWIASGSDDYTVQVWDARNGNHLLTYKGHSRGVATVAWSPDGRWIASGGDDQTTQVWDARNGNHLLTYKGHSSSVNTLAWSPDGTEVVSGSSDTTVQVWRPTVGSGPAFTAYSARNANRLLYVYHGHTDAITSATWLPDGKRITSGSYDQTVQVWDAANGDHVYTYRGHSKIVTCVAPSPDGTQIASGSDDQTVQVWDVANGDPVYTYYGHALDSIHCLAWSPDGTRIASGGQNSMLQVWDVQNRRSITIHSGAVWTVAWSPDGTQIVSGSDDQTVQIWDAQSGQNLLTYTLHSGKINSVAWSSDGKYIASGSDDQTVQVWDAQNGNHLLTYKGHSNPVRRVSWSPDGTRIASGGEDSTVQVWDTQSGNNLLIYNGHANGIGAVAWSPDGTRIVSGSWDTTIQVWKPT
jgi:WD40 repeat protein/serine/threonine protein kinase